MHSALRATLCGVLLAVTACSARPTPTAPSHPPATEVSAVTTVPAQQPRIEEITFQSGSFGLVGDLRLPEGTGPFPVVLFVHGSGDADRTLFGLYLPIMERMLRAGYAVFSWDKPGYGESTGQISGTRVYHQLARIVLDAIEVMKARPEIDPQRIGLWGISQASWVMPLVLSQSEDVAFMICVSCAGVAGADQMAYQIISQTYCAGVAEEKADELRRLLSELDSARTFETYADYVHYREVLDALAGIGSETPGHGVPGVVPEEAWRLNDPENEGWWNPIQVIEQVRIPVLAIFGDRDTQLDPLQGAHAYQEALEKAGNPSYLVEIIPDADHLIGVSATGCVTETNQTIEHALQDQGYWPESRMAERFQEEPGPHTPLSAFPFAPGYLDLIEDWLSGLPRSH
jgi:pimeloyl-ACP methyl ester carboxylesterase